MRLGMFLVAAGLALASTPALAVDQLIPGKIHIIKEAKLTKMVSKGAFLIPTPGGATDPTLAGGTLGVFDTADGLGLNVTLPLSGWKGLGNPAGSKGWKYKGAGSVADPCKVVLVKERVIKFTCKDDQSLNPPLGSTSGIILTLGPSDRYCAEFGGTDTKNVAGLLKRKDAPQPVACPTPGGGGTTTTSLGGGTTSTSTTTTLTPCCNGDGFIRFTTNATTGDCGDIVSSSGMVVANILCGGYYAGGGGNATPLPIELPDLQNEVTAITACVGQLATLGATTSVQTGSNRNCTSAGCLYGPPFPVPNPGSPPVSYCMLNRLSAGVTGSTNCATGATSASVALDSIFYLTGDTATDPASTIASIQPCPLCSGGTCIGGTNNGMACTAATTALNPSYPTSQDCPPDPMFDIGTLPFGFTLSSGVVSWTATTATNDTEVEFNQSRVFSGFCRDFDGTLAFETPANLCWENGMAVGGACAGVFETCEQRTNGAFGPAGGANMTITAVGSASSIIGGPASASLVGVFTHPLTFDATVDAASDLPGPAALAYPGTLDTCATASPCP